jgi:hypothetical protein
MRKLLVSLIALLAIALVPSVASATHSNGPGPDKDYVAGSGKGPLATPLGTFPSQYHANAQSDAVGGAADGHWFTNIFPTGPFASLGTVTIGGTVLCVSAAGNDATWRGVIEQSNSGLAPPGAGVITRWVDNGEGNDPDDSQIGFLTSPPGPNPSCPQTTFDTLPNLQGNLVVHDGI